MLQVTVKTLDSQNHSFSVPDESSVKDFKTQIAPVLGIDADKQRLIFCGRVLQDDKKLTEYDVDGKVIHLVQRPPPQSQTYNNSSSGASSNVAAAGTSHPAGTARQTTLRDGSSFLLGAFSIPQDVIDPAHVQNIVQDVVSGMGEWGRNATVMSRTSDDGSSVDVHIDLGHVPLQSEAQLRINQIRTMLTHANTIIQSLDNVASGRPENSSSVDSDQRGGSNLDPEGNETRVTGQDTTDDTHSRNQQQVNQPPLSTSQDVPMFSHFCDTSANSNSTASTAAPPTSSSTVDSSTLRAGTFSFSPLTIPISQSSSSSGSSSFGEGLAQAARAAVAAAVAAASTAAVRAGAPSSVSVRHSVAVRTVDRDQDSNSNQSSQRNQSGGQTFHTNSSEQHPEPESDQRQSSDDHSQQVPAEGSSVSSSSNEPTSATPVTSATTSSSTSSTNATGARREVAHPRIEVIANLWEEVNALNNRLSPHLQRCMEVIRSDATLTSEETRQAQNMYNWISKIMHFLSHIYHSLSDMYVNFNQSSPRTLRVRIVSSSSSPAFFHSRAVPVHAQINISTPSTSSADSSATATAPSSARPAPTPLVNPFANMTELQADTVTSTEGERPVPSAPPADASMGSQRPASGVQTEQSFVPLFGQNSPFVFMEVGPGRFQLDRPNIPLLENLMEEHAARTTESGPTPPRTTTESERRLPTPLPPEPQQQQTTATTRAPSSTSTPSFTMPPSFTTSGGARGMSGVPLHAFTPVGLPMPFGGFDSFDPNLPCNSIWALDTSLRRRHNAGPSTSSSQSARMNLGVTPNAQGRQDDQFHNIISGLVSSLFNQPMQGGSSSASGVGEAQEVPGFTMFATTTTINGRRRSRSAGPSANRNTNSSNREATEPMDSTQSSQTTSSRNAATPPEPQFDLFSLFAEGSPNQLASAIINPGASLADILQNDDSDLVEGESVIQDLFICLARELNIPDFTSLVCGCGEPLTRIRCVLQRFVRERVLRNREPTEENINQAVEDILAEGEGSIGLVMGEANIKPDIDYEATMKTFARHNLKKLINLVLNGPNTSSFGTSLYAECRKMLMELISLHNHCFVDGVVSFRRIFEQRIRDMTSSMSGILRSISWDDDYNSLQNVNVPFADLRQYLVHRLPSPESVVAAEAQRSEEAEMNSPPPSNANQMSTENQPSADSCSEIPMSTEASIAIDVSGRENRSVATATASLGTNLTTVNNNSTDEQLSQQLPDVIVGSESWHNSVPREWVPIIARDIHRQQRRQAPQNMFSDAYLGGMPSKRRKVMSNGPASSSLLASAPNALSETLQQAISAAGVRPRTSVEQVRREAALDLSLQKAYKEQLKYSIQERLQNDMDYNPDRFPNAEKYFNNQ